MKNFLLVGAGGFLGSVSRYWLGGLVTQAASASRFPYGTFVVNVTGCLAIGVIAGLGERADMFSPSARLFLMTGLLGGYTTFSAFAYESYFLGREQAWLSAVLNVSGQVGLGLLAVLIGHRLALMVTA